jgi:hypothetical protein
MYARPGPDSCHAALERSACAPFLEEKRMKFTEATKFNRKSGEGRPPNVSPARKGWEIDPEDDPSAVGAALNQLHDSISYI